MRHSQLALRGVVIPDGASVALPCTEGASLAGWLGKDGRPNCMATSCDVFLNGRGRESTRVELVSVGTPNYDYSRKRVGSNLCRGSGGAFQVGFCYWRYRESGNALAWMFSNYADPAHPTGHRARSAAINMHGAGNHGQCGGAVYLAQRVKRKKAGKS